MNLLQRRPHPRFRLSRLLARVDLVAEVVHTTGNSVSLLPHGGDFFPALFAAIRSAQHSISLEFYIIKNDATGALFAQALLAAAARGVQVLLVYDALGCFDTPDNYFSICGGPVSTVSPSTRPPFPNPIGSISAIIANKC